MSCLHGCLLEIPVTELHWKWCFTDSLVFRAHIWVLLMWADIGFSQREWSHWILFIWVSFYRGFWNRIEENLQCWNKVKITHNNQYWFSSARRMFKMPSVLRGHTHTHTLLMLKLTLHLRKVNISAHIFIMCSTDIRLYLKKLGNNL